jgi:hypothetical protein
MKTVFLSITHGFQARDLLRTDVFRVLRDNGVRVVILTPNHQDDYFVGEFSGAGVVLEPLWLTAGRLENMMAGFRRYVLANYRLNRTIHALNEKFYRSRRPTYLAIRALNSVFGRLPAARRAWTALEGRLFPGHQYDDLFRKYTPGLVVTGTPGTIPADAHLIRAARRFGVATACVVLSWDNLTSKGHMAARPDELIVWNDVMRSEAQDLHDYPADRVHVAGVAHFDVYGRLPPPDRERFMEGLGLDPSRRLITFGTISPWLFPLNGDVAEILAVMLVDRPRFACQLMIRLHPQVLNAGTPHTENVDRFKAIAAKYPHVHLDLPSVRSHALMWDVAESDMLHLAQLLRYSDVSINAGSTLSIDSAIVDTPIVNIGFDGHHEVPYAESVVRMYDFTHYANLVKTGGVRIARSAQELAALIDMYLDHPEADREGRQRLVRDHCFRIDGRSGLRVGRLLMSMLNRRPVQLREADRDVDAVALDRTPSSVR